MAYTLNIQNESGTVRAEITPSHGGMVSQLYLNDRPCLRLDRAVLETAPMAAGGMPLLFPFPSKTKDDTYCLDGNVYRMPMHGLVKNAPFAVKEVQPNKVTLWITSNPAWISECYPFDFELDVTYEILNNVLRMVLQITNHSDKPMPHYFGWHPFFYSTNKEQIFLKHAMQVHYDYQNYRDLPSEGDLDLSQWWDDVFHSPTEDGFRLRNEADGYEVSCRTDKAFQSLVVCSWVTDSMCVEPWCGLPDSINQDRFVLSIPPCIRAVQC